MERFVTRHRTRIVGILSGFDRVLFRGTLRSISYVDGLDKFLSTAGMVTGEQIAARLGVGRTTIGRCSPPVPDWVLSDGPHVGAPEVCPVTPRDAPPETLCA